MKYVHDQIFIKKFCQREGATLSSPLQYELGIQLIIILCPEHHGTISRTSSPRATIAHLRVNKYSHRTKCFFFFFFFFEEEEDLIKIEDAGVATTLKIDFSNIQGQLTPQSRVESGSNLNSSKKLWLSLLLPRMKKI